MLRAVFAGLRLPFLTTREKYCLLRDTMWSVKSVSHQQSGGSFPGIFKHDIDHFTNVFQHVKALVSRSMSAGIQKYIELSLQLDAQVEVHYSAPEE
ncbi:hypothetical protein CEXT_95261 [Caerostris extrusa]|uniref:Uncharacterized protein n=1 Tax=Caerostris extrusa TaxID=172846 RepID=A0AAV4VVS0_CAEEX|nr:hypothetical protein CEXT_95261 [Caerostris extrusa]